MKNFFIYLGFNVLFVLLAVFILLKSDVIFSIIDICVNLLGSSEPKGIVDNKFKNQNDKIQKLETKLIDLVKKFKRVLICIIILTIFIIHYLDNKKEINDLINKFPVGFPEKSFVFFYPILFIFFLFLFVGFLKDKKSNIRLNIIFLMLFGIICPLLLNIKNFDFKFILNFFKILFIIFVYKLWKWESEYNILENKSSYIKLGIIITIIYLILTLTQNKLLDSIVILSQDVVLALLSVYVEKYLKSALKSEQKNDNDKKK